MRTLLWLIAILFTFEVLGAQNNISKVEWIAPKSADSEINPLVGKAVATEEGKKLFVKLCAVCHGDKGKGDGIGGLALAQKPRNFTLDKTQLQSDGSLFWKMTEGRAPMASYKTSLTVEQRWQLVNFIRTFSKKKTETVLAQP